MLCGIVIDFIIRKKKKTDNLDYHICNEEHCHCEKGIFTSTIIHTLKTFLFILVITFIMNIIFEYLGHNYLSKLLLKMSFFKLFA